MASSSFSSSSAPAQQLPISLTSKITTPTFLGNCTYVHETPMEEENKGEKNTQEGGGGELCMPKNSISLLNQQIQIQNKVHSLIS